MQEQSNKIIKNYMICRRFSLLWHIFQHNARVPKMFHQMHTTRHDTWINKEKWEQHNGAAEKDIIRESAFIYFKKHGDYYGYYVYYQRTIVQQVTSSCVIMYFLGWINCIMFNTSNVRFSSFLEYNILFTL